MPQQLPDGTWVSDEGAYHLRNGQWHPLPPKPAGSLGVFWFTACQGWFSTLLVIGLLALVPIAGSMNLYGWALVTSRNLRAGHRVLAPANFSYVGTGARYVAWELLVTSATLFGALAAGVLALIVVHATSGWVWGLTIAMSVFYTTIVALTIPLLILRVPVLQLIADHGFGPALSPKTMFGYARANSSGTWYSVLVFLVWYLCYFGVVGVASMLPFGSIFASLLGLALLGAFLATALARFQDPGYSCNRGQLTLAKVSVIVFAALAIIGLPPVRYQTTISCVVGRKVRCFALNSPGGPSSRRRNTPAHQPEGGADPRSAPGRGRPAAQRGPGRRAGTSRSHAL